MRKFTTILMLLCCFCSFAQLAEEDFEGSWSPVVAASGSSTDWLILDNGIGLNFTWVQEPHSDPIPSFEGTAGTFSAYIDKENVSAGSFAEDFLVTPEFTMPVGGVLTFQSKLSTADVQGSIYRVYILTGDVDPADPGSYIGIQEWTESQLAISPIMVWEEKAITFGSAYDGQTVRVAFSMTGDNYDRWQLDKVSVTAPCGEVENLSTSNIGLTTADLSWDNPGGSTSWEIEIIPEGGVPTGHGVVYTGSLPYTANSIATGTPLVTTPLLSDTGYKYYVKAICSDGGYSDWVGASFFDTVGLGDTCAAAIEITALPYSNTDNTANFSNNYAGNTGIGCGNQDFEGSPSGNDVVYRYTADFTGTISIDLSDMNPYAALFIYNECSDFDSGCLGGAVSGELELPVELDFEVIAGEDYYILISSYYFETTNYTLTIQQASCEEPVGLPVTNLGFTTASLSWTNPGGAASWQVELQPADSGIPPGPGEYTLNTNSGWPVPTADLAPSTAYEYYVRADCGDGTFSAWGGPYYFNTAICEPEDKCTYLFTMWNDYGGGWNGYTMDVVQNSVIVATLAGPQTGEPEIQEVALCDGYPFSLYWNTDGFSAEGIRLSVENNFAQEIYTKYLDTGAPGQTLYYQDVLDCELPLCLSPTGLTASNPTLTTIDLAWDGPATGEWEYFIVEAGSDAPEAADNGTLTTTNPAVAAGALDGATEYEYYLRILCDGASTPTSAWAGPFPFSSSVCAEEDKCEYTFVMKSEWGSGWYGGYMTISQGGVTVDEIGAEFTTGTEMEVTVMLCHDEPIEIFWNSGGGYDFQMGLDVKNQFEQVFFSMPFNSGGLNSTIYEGTADCLVPLCLPPSGLTASNPTTTTTDLAWDGPATGQWEYFITEAGQPGPTNSSTGTLTSTNPTIGAGPLAPATIYDYYVRMVCEDAAEDYSDWAGPFEFNSALCEADDKCDYTFIMKAGWSNGWLGGSMTITQNDIVVDVIGSEFSSGVSYNLTVPLCDDLPIEVKWNSGGAWAGQMGLDIVNNFGQTVFSLPVNNGGSQLGQVIFEGDNDCDTPACITPTGLYGANETPTSIDLGWGGPASGAWEYYIVAAGEPAPDAATAGTLTNNNPTIGVPLPDPATNYEYYVRMVCEGEDDYSLWSLPRAIHSAVCEPEDRCVYTFEMINNQYPGYQGNTMVITQSGTPVATIGSQFTMGTSMTVDVLLCPNVHYDVTWVAAFNTNIGLIIRNSYDEVEFTMQSTALPGVIYTGTPTCDPPSCPKPVDFSVSNVSDYSIDLDWTELGTATEWEVYITQQGATAPVGESVGVIADSVPFTLTEGIAPGVNYDVYVRSLCVDDEISLWTGPLAFQSALCPLEDQCSYTFTQSTGMAASNGFDGWIGDVMYIIQEGVVVATLEGPMVEDNNEDVEIVVNLCNDVPFTVQWDNPGGTLENQYVGLSITNNFTGDIVFDMPPVAVQTVPLGDIFTAVTECTDCEPVEASDANSIIVCSAGDQTAVDLDEAVEGIIENPELYNFDYYETEEAAAIGSDDNIPAEYAAATGITTLWVRIFRENETCFAVKEFTVTVYETPEAVEMEDVTECDSYVLPVLPAGNNYFTATNGEGIMLAEGDVINVSQTIYIYAQSGTIPNCTNETSFTVTITIRPEVITPGDQNACSVYLLPELALGNYYTGPGATGAMLEPGDEVTITQDIYVYAGTNDCFDEAVFAVTVFEMPEAVEMEDITGCDSFTLPAISDGNDYFTAQNGGGVMLVEGDVISTSQTIYIFAQSGTEPNCTDESDFVLTIVPSPQFSLGGPYVVCNASNLEIEVTGQNFDLEDAVYEWKINGIAAAETGSNITATEFGTYEVTVTVNGCSTTHSVEVIEDGVGIMAAIDDFCDNNDVYTVEVQDIDGSFEPDTATYSWTGPQGFTASSQAITPTLTGTYTVEVTTYAGCTGIAVFEMTGSQCFIQRGISPNGDGANDFFDLTEMDVQQINIFNRYGQHVFSMGDYTNQWHGQADNGDELPTGTYFYMIQRGNGEQVTGWIYINREE